MSSFKQGLIIAGVVVGLIGSAVTWKHLYDKARRAEGALMERTREWESERDSLRLAIATRDTVFVRDTLRLVQWRQRFDTLRQSVVVNIHDTITVKEFVRVADSTVATCTAALGECSLLYQSAKAQIAVQDSLIMSYRVQIPKPPGVISKTVRNVERVLAIVGLGTLVYVGVRQGAR